MPRAMAQFTPSSTKLVFGEMAAQLVVDTVVDRQVVGREEVGEGKRGLFGVRQVRGVGRVFQRTHGVFGDAVVDGAVIADRHAASALVVEREAQPDELDEPGRKRSGRAERRVECAEVLPRPSPVGRHWPPRRG